MLELAQAVMDTTDRSGDRNTVCTINELLGAMPHRTQRSAADVLLSQLADQVQLLLLVVVVTNCCRNACFFKLNLIVMKVLTGKSLNR